MFFGKKDPLADVKAGIAAQDIRRINLAIEKVVEKFGYSSETTHAMSRLLEEKSIVIPNFSNAYIDQNPNLITTAHLMFAGYLAQIGEPDLATSSARHFVRRILGSEQIKAGSPPRQLRNMAAQGYLNMTAAYTSAGARSYSLRLLQQGLMMSPEANVTEFLKNEMNQLRQELTDPAAAELDAKWEGFFKDFKNFDELYAHCEKLKFDELARRLDLLMTRHRFDFEYQISPAEFMLEVFTVNASDPEKRAYLLQ